MNPLVNTRFANTYTKIRCERHLIRPGETTVRVGSTVSPNQVVARIPEPVQFYIVPANEQLGVPPAAITEYLLVDIGDAVEVGDPLLQKKGMFGTRTVESPISGKVSVVQNGRVILETMPRLTELRAMVKGRVTGFVGDHTIVMETPGTLIQALWSSGVEAYGPLKITVEQPHQPLTAANLKKHENHILVAGTVQDEALLEQAAFEEVIGLIVGTMNARLCDVARRLQIPLILTDGIGNYPMARPFFDHLQQWEGHEASLLTSADKERRPEIVIPHPVTADQAQLPTYQPLAPGHTVRLLRQPYQGQIGQIVQLLNKTQVTETGIKTHGAMVALAEAQTVFVPYANMEAIL